MVPSIQVSVGARKHMNGVIELREEKAFMAVLGDQRMMPDEAVAGISVGIDEEDQLGLVCLIGDTEIIAQFRDIRQPRGQVYAEGIRGVWDEHHAYRHAYHASD